MKTVTILYKVPQVILLILLTTIAPISLVLAALPYSKQSTLAPILKKTMPAVVNIKTTSIQKITHPWFNDPFFKNFFPPTQQEASSIGSGVIIDAKNGLIITNQHVIANSNKIQVRLMDGREFEATLIGEDTATDLALIKINANNLVEIEFSDSKVLEVGDFVIAIGNPFGLDHTVTSGIISALGRSGSEAGFSGPYKTFIQTDASINPGNSGGALITLDGELAGINSAIISQSGGNVGIGFAVPSNLVSQVVTQLRKYGLVKRGNLGVNAQTLTPELASAFSLSNNIKGALITEVQKGSVAERGGLQSGDVVTMLNGTITIISAPQLISEFGQLAINTLATLTAIRNNKIIQVRVTVSDKSIAITLDGKKLHPRLQGAFFGVIDKLDITKDQSTISSSVISVIRVEDNSLAAQVGLMASDTVIKVNGDNISSLSEFEKAFKRSKFLEIILLRGSTYLTLRVQQ
ncbi:MAG: trypsin-like peptidase domain-containing protein [Methylacidiphilales bacterium]|nr:trypsin-like peptidase domain-containing protein [Candidatus Methylacidiphilales bacterium]